MRNHLASLYLAPSMSGISHVHLCGQLLVCLYPSVITGGHLDGSFRPVKRSRLVMDYGGLLHQKQVVENFRPTG
jgi:hypothetical protein